MKPVETVPRKERVERTKSILAEDSGEGLLHRHPDGLAVANETVKPVSKKNVPSVVINAGMRSLTVTIRQVPDGDT